MIYVLKDPVCVSQVSINISTKYRESPEVARLGLAVSVVCQTMRCRQRQFCIDMMLAGADKQEKSHLRSTSC